MGGAADEKEFLLTPYARICYLFLIPPDDDDDASIQRRRTTKRAPNAFLLKHFYHGLSIVLSFAKDSIPPVNSEKIFPVSLYT